ncbi:hypothetical protein EOM86_12390, partial [Candidatus Nomurabacteria bacterium]|nr:hypothetical protein [Candidatus Nomurabacteria bacterium]
MSKDNEVSTEEATILEAQQYLLTKDKTLRDSYEDVQARAFDIFEKVLDRIGQIPDVDFSLVEKNVVNRTAQIVDDAIKNFVKTDKPAYEELETIMFDDASEKLGGTKDKATKEKAADDVAVDVGVAYNVINGKTYDELPPELIGHPDKKLPIVMQAKREYAQGNYDNA